MELNSFPYNIEAALHALSFVFEHTIASSLVLHCVFSNA